MSEFIQLHILTSYPPANLNRDDLGRPKTALFGGSQRQRVSSQSLKRSWRESDTFLTSFDGSLGARTRIRRFVVAELNRRGVKSAIAEEIARKALGTFINDKEAKAGKKVGKKRGRADADEGDGGGEGGDEGRKEGKGEEAIAFLSPAAVAGLNHIIDKAAAGEAIDDKDWQVLVDDGRGTIDIALFGRMLADDPSRSVDAAVQVAHAITVHTVAIEDDYFTAVDELNRKGAAHVDVAEFSAGLFYLYCCVNRSLLETNLAGDEALAARALRGLTEAATTTGPKGKVNSYGSHAYASYVLAERGERQPRNLSVAFLKDVQVPRGSNGGSFLSAAIESMESTRERFDRAYGPNAREHYVLDVEKGKGTLDELLAFVERKG